MVSLRAELAAGQAELVRSREQLGAAVERIAELEAQVSRTSKNSSQPPSADGLSKGGPKPRSLRKKTGRRPGGQDGHEGTTLAQVARPRYEVRHERPAAGGAGTA